MRRNIEQSKTNIDMMKTGRKLKAIAERNGYTAKDIQEYLGLSCPQPVYRWYKGIILPSIDNLFRLSELYHVHMEELLVTNDVIFMEEIEPLSGDKTQKYILAYVVRMIA